MPNEGIGRDEQIVPRAPARHSSTRSVNRRQYCTQLSIWFGVADLDVIAERLRVRCISDLAMGQARIGEHLMERSLTDFAD